MWVVYWLVLGWAASTEVYEFPSLDLRAYLRADRATQDLLAAELDATCRGIGFFVVVNHGVKERTIRRTWERIGAFFDLPAEAKAAAPQMDDDYVYGYSALEGETLSRGAGEGGTRPDLKEMFATGPYDPRSGAVAPRYPSAPRGFERAWHEYYLEMERLAASLLRVMARALRLEDDWFEPFADRHMCAMRALNYPALATLADATGRLRASPHTDYGALTILRSGGPGLQVRNRSSDLWVDVPDVKESHFVINLGDLMSRWTNERWVSTPHQVVFRRRADNATAVPREKKHTPLATLRSVLSRKPAAVNGRRQSLAFFHNLNSDADVSAIQTCVQPGDRPKHAPIQAVDLLMQKHRAATRRTAPPPLEQTHEQRPEAFISDAAAAPAPVALAPEEEAAAPAAAPSFPPPTTPILDDPDL